MRIGPLFKCFGSKWAASRHYPDPIYETILEPFAGGVGYSLNHCEKNIVLYDVNRNMHALWTWLVEVAAHDPALVRAIPLDLPEGTDIRSLGLTIGQQLLLKHWQRTNNIGECWTTSPWGNKPGQWTANTRARVADEVQAVRHWRVSREPIGWESTNAVYFVDPPYQFNYQYGVKGFDWDGLASDLAAIPEPHQLICCEARCPTTGRVPTWAPFVDFRSTVTSRRKTTEHHHSKELVYCR